MKESLLEYIRHFGLFTSIAIATILVALLVNRYFKHQIRKSSAELNADPTTYKFLRHAVSAIIYIVGFSIAIYSIPELRRLANSLLAGAGILAVAIGFASQQALSNIISGVFIIIFKPFRVNDRVTIHSLSGVVEDITLRHTVIRDFEHKRIVIPNSVVSNEIVVNADYEETKLCKWIEIGISYDSNIDKAKVIMREEVMAHPNWLDNRTDEEKEEGITPVRVRVLDLGDFAVTIRAWAWANDVIEAFEMKCDLLESIKKRFDNEGIEIPFPYRTVVYKTDLQEKPDNHE